MSLSGLSAQATAGRGNLFGIVGMILAAVATALGYVEERRAGLFGRPPLLTRGTVEIFRHDWPLDSSQSVQALGYAMTPLEQGLPRLLGPEPRTRPNDLS